MIKPLSLVVLLAVPAAAQDRAAETDFQNALEEARREASILSPQIAAIESTLDAMNDGVGAGEAVVAYVRAKGVRIVVAAQPEAVKTVNGVIRLSDSLPAYPRVYGPLI